MAKLRPSRTQLCARLASRCQSPSSSQQNPVYPRAPDCICSLIYLVFACLLCARQSSHLRNDAWNLCGSIHHTHQNLMPSDLCPGVRSSRLTTRGSSFKRCWQQQPPASHALRLHYCSLCFASAAGPRPFTYLHRGSMPLAAHSSGQLHEVSAPAYSTLPRCRRSRGCQGCRLCSLRSEAIQRRQELGSWLCGPRGRSEPQMDVDCGFSSTNHT